MINNVLKLIRPNPTLDYQVWKKQYAQVKSYLTPRLKIMNDDEISNLFADWMKILENENRKKLFDLQKIDLSNKHSIEKIENLSKTILLSVLYYNFTQNPLSNIFSNFPNYEGFFSTKCMFILRIFLKTIKMHAKKSHNYEFCFSHSKNFLLTHLKNANFGQTYTIDNNSLKMLNDKMDSDELIKADEKKINTINSSDKTLNLDLLPNFVYIIKSMKKFIPNEVILLIKTFPYTFNFIAYQLEGKLQDIFIDSILELTDYDGSSFLQFAPNNRNFLDSFCKIEKVSQIYSISKLITQHLQYEEYNTKRIFKLIVDYLLSYDSEQNEIEMNSHQYQNSNYLLNHNLIESESDEQPISDENNLINIENISSLPSEEIRVSSGSLTPNINIQISPQDSILDRHINFFNMVQIKKEQKTTQYQVHEKPKHPCYYLTEYSDYDFLKSIDIFIRLFTKMPNYDIDLNQLLKFLVRHPLNCLSTYVKKFYTSLDFSIILESGILSDCSIYKCNNFFCRFRLLKTILKINPDFIINTNIQINSQTFDCSEICPHFIKTIKANPILLSHEIQNKFLKSLDDKNVLRLVISLISSKLIKVIQDTNHTYLQLTNANQPNETIINFDISIFQQYPDLYLQYIKHNELVDEKNDQLLQFIFKEKNTMLRLKAINLLIPTCKLSCCSFFYSFLYDKSFKIRNCIFSFIPKFVDSNPLFNNPEIDNYIQHVIESLTSSNDAYTQYKVSKLLVNFGLFCNKLSLTKYSSNIIESIMTFLHDSYPFDNALDTLYLERISSSASITSLGSSSNFGSSRSVKTKLSVKEQVNIYINEKYLSKRDKTLLMILSNLGGDICKPYLNQILNVFLVILKTKKKEAFLNNTIKSLTRLCRRTKGGLNLNSYLPEIQDPLLSLLKNTKNNILKISILELFGCSFDCLHPNQQFKETRNSNIKINALFNIDSSSSNKYDNNIMSNRQQSEKNSNNNEITYSQSNIVDHIMQTLLSHNFEGHLWELKIIYVIFESKPNKVRKYANDFILKIIKFLNSMKSNRPDILYKCLAITLLKCPNEASQLIPDLKEVIEVRINEIECLKMCVTLCQSLSKDYQSLISTIYDLVLQRLSLFNTNYFKWAIRFLSLAIYRFDMQVDFYFIYLAKSDFKDKKEILASLEFLVQKMNMKYFLAHIYQIASSLQLDLKNLILSIKKYQTPILPQIVSCEIGIANTEMESNINVVQREIKRDVKSFVKLYEKPKYFFLDINEIHNVNDFVGELINLCFINSPDPIFRAISEFLYTAWNLARNLFPAAFKAIWEICTQEDRKHFSLLLYNVFEKQEIPNYQYKKRFNDKRYQGVKNLDLLNMIEYMDLNGYLFEIDYLKISMITPSPNYSLLIMQRYFIQNHILTSEMSYKLFDLSRKLDKKDNFRALFVEVKEDLDPNFLASCHSFLGNWDEALNIYEKLNNLPKKINCLFSLHRYDEMVEHFHDFMKLFDHECDICGANDSKSLINCTKEKMNALSFYLWVFAIRRENFRIEKILKKFKFIERGNLLYPQIVYYITTNNYKKAKDLINIAFKKLLNYDFENGDYYSNQKKLCIIQLLAEYNEIIDIKMQSKLNLSSIDDRTDIEDTCEIWNRRIKGFDRADWMWERLILSRSILRPINSFHECYIPMISELRKGGHFGIIHNFFEKSLQYSSKILTFDEHLKLEWAEGFKVDTYFSIATSVGFRLVKNIYEFIYLIVYQFLHTPAVLLNTFAQSPVFGLDLRNYVASYFETVSFENAMNMLQIKTRAKQQEFFIHLISKFADQLFNSYLFNIGNKKDSFAHLCQLTGKFATEYDTKISYRYYNAARKQDPYNIKNLKGWALTNLSLFMEATNERKQMLSQSEDFLPLDDEAIDESMGSLDLESEDYSNNFENSDSGSKESNSSYSNKISSIKITGKEVDSTYESSYDDKKAQVKVILKKEPNHNSLAQVKKITPSFSFSEPLKNSNITDSTISSNSSNGSNDNLNIIIDEKQTIHTNDDNKSALICPINKADCCFLSSKDSVDIAEKFLSGEAEELGKKFALKHCAFCPPLEIPDSEKEIVNDRRQILKESVSCFSKEPNKYAFDLIDACLQIVEYNTNFSLEFLVQLFFSLFSIKDIESLPDNLKKRILNLNPRLILRMLPQISIHINSNQKSNILFAEKLLKIAAMEDFQSVYFSLNFLVKNGSKNANEILEELKNSSQINSANNIISLNTNISTSSPNSGISSSINSINKYSSECAIFEEGMYEISQSIYERWKNAIETAPTSFFNCDNILSASFNETNHPKTEFDKSFVERFGSTISKCETLFKNHSPKSIKEMWDILNELYQDINDALYEINELSLPIISTKLSAIDFSMIQIPGTKSKNSPISQPLKLAKIDNKVTVYQSVQRPRCLKFIARETGETFKFLLKAKEDLRTDQRIMQFFSLINSFIHNNKLFNRDKNLEIMRYTILPLRKDCGLISFVKNSESFQQLVVSIRKQYPNKSLTKNIKLKDTVNIEKSLDEQFSSNSFNTMNNLQRIELFNYISENTNAIELFSIFFYCSSSSSDCVNKLSGFTKSLAVMSMVGHVIGLGDRHPSNILIDVSNGRVVHIDLGDCFDSTQIRKRFPEKVPFRLTRMFVNALEGNRSKGIFESICIKIMKLIRRKKSSLAAQLAVFIKESQREKSSIERVIKKLNGAEFDEHKTVEDQVHTLIQIAEDPKNYCRHFIGWCPFW